MKRKMLPFHCHGRACFWQLRGEFWTSWHFTNKQGDWALLVKVDLFEKFTGLRRWTCHFPKNMWSNDQMELTWMLVIFLKKKLENISPFNYCRILIFLGMLSDNSALYFQHHHLHLRHNHLTCQMERTYSTWMSRRQWLRTKTAICEYIQYA